MISGRSIKNFLFEYNFENRFSSEFCQQLYAAITGCSFYYFKETTNHYYPDTAPDYDFEPSRLKRLERRVEIWNKLDETFGLKDLEESYKLFEDNNSKRLFIMRILNNIDDQPLVRFPIFYSKQFQDVAKIALLADESKTIKPWYNVLKLVRFPLHKLGIDITLWGNPMGIFIEFMLDQYRYKDIVYIKDGDNVLDAGGCYGDTALHFASQTSGKIYTFEFIKENIEVFHMNMELNPKYKDRITLVERPLGNTSGEKLYAVFNGPGTSILDHKVEGALEYSSITIDDFVKENNFERIDFMKFDIEGSEENALKGASETIRKFKPKLAICGYHKKDDLVVLPKLMKKLVPEYSLYLDHHTINATETVIYAAVPGDNFT